LCALALVLVFSTAPASAALTHPFLDSFGSTGVGSGSFGAVKSVAVDSSTGDVYVFDAAKEAIYKFNAAGEPVDFSALGKNVVEGVASSGGGAEQQIAVDSSAGPAKGDIYVANNKVVRIWGEDGNPIEVGGKPAELTGPGGEACGVAVDSSGVVYVGFYPETVIKYTPVSNPVTDANETASMGGLKSICNIAVDGEGNVYAATYTGGVNEYGPLQFGSPAAIGTPIDEESGNTLAVDPSIAGRVYIDEQNAVAEYETPGIPKRLGVSGASEPGALNGSTGVAASGASGGETLYASSASSAGKINRYGPSVPLPDVAVEEVTSLKTMSVTLNGTVNPSSNTIAAEYQFEYGTSPAYGNSLPASPAPVGLGEAPVSVSAALSGLEPNTTYHYRLNGININGTNHGTDHTFTTPGPPRILAEPAEAIAQKGATLSARLSADGFQTTYHFEYGETTGYGASTPTDELEPSEEHTVNAALTGLKVGTRYHFRLIASSEIEGKLETVTGEDQEFTTLAAAPIISESVASLAPTTVQLDATIDPLGNDTHAYFQYGTENCAEHPAACANAPAPPGADLGAGTGHQATSVALTGLTPETTYHYRVIAANTLGITEGPDETFTTYAAPPASGGCPNEQIRSETRSNGLPDCRVYEQVSPPEKSGNQAAVNNAGDPQRALANADGTAVAYETSGAVGNTPAGEGGWVVSRRGAAGWSTTSAIPRVQEQVAQQLSGVRFSNPSPDLSHFEFGSNGAYASSPDVYDSTNIFLTGDDPFVEPVWLGRPAIATPNPPLGFNASVYNNAFAGGSSTYGTVYFTYLGTLVPEDEPRAETPVFKEEMTKYIETNGGVEPKIWGFYEWKSGTLASAGILPSGQVHPFGAVPAAIVHSESNPDQFDNEVSTDGARAFFVSPDPASTGGSNPVCQESGYEVAHPGGCVPELYVRKNGTETALVSRDVLLSKADEPPAPAPHGPRLFESPTYKTGTAGSSYVYASPDGSHAFFQSGDKLAKSAAGEEPTGSGPWTYDFNVDAGSLTYLPGVVGPIVASSTDGSRFVFENTATEALDLWSREAGGGQVTEVAKLPAPQASSVHVAPARATADGSVFVFETDSAIPGGFNNGGGFDQVYRYDVAAGVLNCVSCPPKGITPTGGARLSNDDQQPGNDVGTGLGAVSGSRGISADGSRIFFDTPDPLVAQDINGHRDVYEWEAGHVHLISSGTGSADSFFLDNSESGEDVFFATADNLAAADTDSSYDVYDARMGVPSRVTSPVCSGTGCQGVPAPSPTFATPSSATFNGVGNYPTSSNSSPKRMSRAQLNAKKLEAALRTCRRKHDRRKRLACESRARKRYAPPQKAKKTNRRAQ